MGAAATRWLDFDMKDADFDITEEDLYHNVASSSSMSTLAASPTVGSSGSAATVEVKSPEDLAPALAKVASFVRVARVRV